MTKSKIIASTAIATVMSASAAQAEISISGGMAGWFITGDQYTSMNRQWNTESVNVSYSATLDNGMGISVTANVGETGHTHTQWGPAATSTVAGDVNMTMSISSDMGTLTFGDQMASATDRADNIVALSLFECCTWNNTTMDGMAGTNGQYHDGDNLDGSSNEGFEYTAPSMNGWTLRLSHQPTADRASEGANDTNAAAISGSIAGINVAAGINSMGDAATNTAGRDSTFVAAAMGLGPMSVSVGMFDGGANTADATTVVVDMPLMGMNGKAAFVDMDDPAGYDDSGYRLGLAKSLGAATFGIEYDNADTASGDAGEIETWRLGYQVYF